jgi:hypothetical protein
LRSISRSQDNNLDPRPVEGSVAYDNLAETPSAVNYDFTNFNDKNVPEKFNLSAYPNPFNPTTNISFNLPAAQEVKIAVYNIMGERELIVSDAYHSAGKYTYSINASNLSSGIYFIRLQTANRVRVKKVTLLK